MKTQSTNVVGIRRIGYTYVADRLVITPKDDVRSHRTGSLPSGVTVEQINDVLGFEPNYQDDPDKVEYSWAASVLDTVTGETTDIAIWDYKGSRWSTYGDADVLGRLFQ